MLIKTCNSDYFLMGTPDRLVSLDFRDHANLRGSLTASRPHRAAGAADAVQTPPIKSFWGHAAENASDLFWVSTSSQIVDCGLWKEFHGFGRPVSPGFQWENRFVFLPADQLGEGRTGCSSTGKLPRPRWIEALPMSTRPSPRNLSLARGPADIPATSSSLNA